MPVSTLIAEMAPVPEYDFSEFGPVEVKPLTRIQRVTGALLGRNWVTIPHVTHNDDLDFTSCDDWRRAWNADNPDKKITPVIILANAISLALKEFPVFNTSLCSDGQSIVQKHYFNVGIAVDTPKGLLVPVLQNLAGKSLPDAAAELAGLAEKARTKGLSMAEMSGSSISLSSLGHIGGTSFTPIINAPDTAIIGALPLRDVPVRGEDDQIRWRKVMPVSLSYDHRVINGADAARFIKCIDRILQSPGSLAA